MSEHRGKVGVFSTGVWRLEGLRELLDAERLCFRPSDTAARSLSAVAGWGHKPTAARARAYARRHGLPYLALEEGFLRSVGLSASEPALSLVVDDVGIYYDAHGPSRLEQLLETDARLDEPDFLARAEKLRKRLLATGVSKYNHASDRLPSGLPPGELVLVADQTYDDASVSGALADSRSFERALECALDEHPDAHVVVKVHPATVAGKKRGYLAGRQASPRVSVLAADVNPQALLSRARHLYVVSSQLGFEGLLAGVKVTCFGQAFYAGWGLTDDRLESSPRRTRRLSLAQLVAGALLLYPRYRHPVTRRPVEAEQVLEHLALQRRLFADNARDFVCFGMSYWKRPFVRRYLRSPGGSVRFVRSPLELELEREPDLRRLTGVIWASRKTEEVTRWAETRGMALWSMEDGFLRSVGLGSDLTAPGSLVLDPDGIYYDPSRPSRLERLLENGGLTDEEVARAGQLRRLIVASRVSKYNLPGEASLRVHARPGQRVLLVPGQVADDASVRLGTQRVGDNLSLLREVRRAHPEAYIVYKPHPDVLSGNRRGALNDVDSPPWDQVVGRVPLAACLDVAHEVHTMTSLVGFEALLRGLPVVTYGQPFYAGWGLTVDHAPLARRTRRLTVDELVAGALLRYPRYVSWSARCFVSAEDKVQELELASRRGRGVPLPRVAIKLRSLLRSGVEWWHGRELRHG